MKFGRFQCFGILTAVLCACPTAPKEKSSGYPVPNLETGGEVVAEVGPVKMTSAELEKRIKQQSPFVRVQLKDPEKMRKFIDDQLRQEILAQEGWQRGLVNDPQIKEELRRAIITRVMKDYLKTLGDSMKVTQAELVAEYQKRQAEYNKPEKIRLSQIVRYTKSPKERKAARALLESVKKDVVNAQKKNNHMAFADAAKKHSHDEKTKNGGGDLQFQTKAQLEKLYGAQVAAHMFDEKQVKIGDLAIAEAENAVVLFKKTGRRRAVERSLEMVKPQLRGQLLGQKKTEAFDAFVNGLKQKHSVVINEAALKKIKVEMNAPTKNAPRKR